VALRVVLVQHGEKEPTPGDPGLTVTGRRQAAAVAASLPHDGVVAIRSSPYRRARDTAAAVAARFALEVTVDERLRERTNWSDPGLESLEGFLTEWQRTTDDRSYVPRTGDSSEAAADRFLAALADLASVHQDGVVVVVTHGGVTVDALRTLLGDRHLLARDPELLRDGVPPGATTWLRWDDEGVEGWVVESLPSTSGSDVAP
jgi:broad specificity phosphatase PhoE